MMSKLLRALALVAILCGSAEAQRATMWDIFAHESVTVSTVSKALTSTTYAPTGSSSSSGKPAEYALITVETDSIRIYMDGTAADASGHLIVANSIVELFGANQIRNFRAIRVTSDATLRVSYGR